MLTTTDFWLDLWKETPSRVSQMFYSRGNIVWSSFTGWWLFCLVIVEGTLASLKYKEMLEYNLIPNLPINRKARKMLIFL